MRPKNKTDAQLRRTQSRFENLALWSGLAVVAGLAIETWLAIEYRPIGEKVAQTWGPILADVMVFGGVFFEIMFGRWSLHQGNELQQRAEKALAEATERAGKAIERAAAAELETEKLRRELSWRRLSAEQVRSMSGFLASLPKLGARILYASNDPEVLSFARDIADVFRNNGWKVQSISMSSHGNFDGIIIPRYAPPDLDACEIIRATFAAAAVEFRGGTPPLTAGSFIVADGDPVSGPCGEINVGTRSRPVI